MTSILPNARSILKANCQDSDTACIFDLIAIIVNDIRVSSPENVSLDTSRLATEYFTELGLRSPTTDTHETLFATLGRVGHRAIRSRFVNYASVLSLMDLCEAILSDYHHPAAALSKLDRLDQRWIVRGDKWGPAD